MTKVLLKSFKITKIPPKPKKKKTKYDDTKKKNHLKLLKYPQNLKNDQNTPET